ncbi:I78 family peptidase inhibitor [Streptomyces sp. NPDC051909]|uniref:I78 family peptidase inhibitor n=1 Tax=Streptomyces sp. NPDC051909 TaxID=3154944 RepID=UPI00341DD901
MTPEHTPDHADETYVGLTEEEAERLARIRGHHVVRALPPGSIITMEYLEGRINFEVEGGVVTRVWHG